MCLIILNIDQLRLEFAFTFREIHVDTYSRVFIQKSDFIESNFDDQ